jgi:GMP synthase (glutamine-hydrolysing)
VSLLVVIKTGSAVPAILAKRRDFEVWIAAGAGLKSGEVDVVDAYLDAPLPEPADVPSVVLTGSPAMVTDRHPWSERTAEWLREVVALGKPVLGICYGHQLLAHALGGEVHYNPRGREIGTVDVTLNEHAKDDPLFGWFPQDLHLPVCHLQSVQRLPEGAQLLGGTELDPHHIFRYGECAWGVQFHPEFDSSIMRSYIELRRNEMLAEGLDASAISNNVMDSADGTFVLRRFAAIARARLNLPRVEPA